MRVLERDPRRGTTIELSNSQGFEHTYFMLEAAASGLGIGNWEHFHQDEIDRLDNAAERLFVQRLEE